MSTDDNGVPLSHLLNRAGKAVFAVTPRKTISSWSEGAQEVFGWNSSEILGESLSKLNLEESILPEVAENNRTGEASGDGKLGPFELAYWSQRLTQNEGGYLVFAEEISEKKFLESALLEATEREQRRIGQELHDHLCQHLLGAAFAAKALAGALDREGSGHAKDLHELARLINDSVTQARDISRGLHPVELDSAGLMSALQELANRVRHTIPCSFECKKSVLVEHSRHAQNAYRIAQEAVVQALQKTGATQIRISLHPSGDSISLTIEDNGPRQGELTSDPEGTVARTLQYRAQAMEGTLTATFEPGKGTRTVCTFSKQP